MLTIAPGRVDSRLPDRAFIATSTESINFGSWLFRVLPKFVVRSAGIFERSLPGHGADVVAPADRPWKEDMARRGAPDARLFAHDINAVYAFRDAVFLSQPVRNGMFPDWILDAVQAMVPERLAGNGRKRIYVSRRRWSQVRKTRTLINEAEVETMLEKRGFTIHRPEDHGLADNARIFAGADIVVGPSGAGMFNAIFCRPGTAILEIEQSAGWRSTHANLYRSAGLRFGFVDNRQGRLQSHGYGHDSYWTDLERLARVVDDLIG
jgi:capsular polysaccharide biosynthesis protein